MKNKYKRCPYCELNNIPLKAKKCKCGQSIEKIHYVKDKKKFCKYLVFLYGCKDMKFSRQSKLDENFRFIRRFNLGLS